MRALLGLSSCFALIAAMTASVSALQSGQPAPDFTLPYSNGGGSVTLSKLRGHPVYLNFFATWCPPCNAEAPTVNEMQIRYRKEGLIVLGVDELENDAKANQYLQEHHLVFRAVVDDGSIHNSYAGFGLPVHVFIDRKGIVRLYRAGEMSNAEIEAAVKSIL
jgi:cytochrome c biogenesis protein CcmG/thiol:disulfide interchange protein DsbE